MQDALERTDRPEPPRREPGIQAIARAGSVLRALASRPEGIGLAELGRLVGLPKSTVHRLLVALAAEGLAEVDEGGRARLGGAVERLAAAGRPALAPRLRPLLEELSAELSETVDLAVLDGASVRFLDQVPGVQRLRAVSAVGGGFPLHCTANGKALLAAIEPASARSLLPARMARMTAKTLTSRAKLLEELERVRASGVAYDREEHTDGICAVGAAIYEPAGVVAALSVPVPSARFDAVERDCAEAVTRAAAKASRLLGAAR
jgi:DNA-binding IclR family transcriptional regulator